MHDVFRYGVAIQKAHQDENGDWIVEGVASTGDTDLQDDTLVSEGLDYSYFLNKGFLKWEHEKNPKNFIGEPLEAQIRKDGFYIKGRLYAHSPLAQEAVQAIETLEKSNAQRRVGFSIEGNVVKRDPRNPKKILKAVIRNVALTMQPVNTGTWASLVKSLASTEALSFDLDKALGTGTGGEAYGTPSGDGSALREESLEQDKKNKLSLFRFIEQLVKKLTERTDPDSADDDLGAIDQVTKGLIPQEANLASYIENHKKQLYKLANRIAGGDLQMQDELAKALDVSLEDLYKSVDMDDDENEDEDALNTEDETEDEDEDDVEKSFFDNFVESDDTIEKALEVSDFLETLVGAISESIDGFSNTVSKSLGKQNTVNTALAKSLQASGEIIKSMNTTLAEQDQLIKSLQESVETLANQPVGRKGITNAREYNTLAKSLGNDGQAQQRLTKSQVVDILVKSVEKGDVDPFQVTRFEVTGQLDPNIAKRLGINY